MKTFDEASERMAGDPMTPIEAYSNGFLAGWEACIRYNGLMETDEVLGLYLQNPGGTD